MTSRQEAQITVELEPEPALDIAEQVLVKIGASIKSQKSNIIFAHKGASLKSWGEDITVSVISSGTGISVVKIISESSLKTTMVDWGANSNNVEKVVQAFKTFQTTTVSVPNRISCPVCGQELEPGTQFCPNDGTPVTLPCPTCGHNNKPATRFCVKCGAKI